MIQYGRVTVHPQNRNLIKIMMKMMMVKEQQMMQNLRFQQSQKVMLQYHQDGLPGFLLLIALVR